MPYIADTYRVRGLEFDSRPNQAKLLSVASIYVQLNKKIASEF